MKKLILILTFIIIFNNSITVFAHNENTEYVDLKDSISLEGKMKIDTYISDSEKLKSASTGALLSGGLSTVSFSGAMGAMVSMLPSIGILSLTPFIYSRLTQFYQENPDVFSSLDWIGQSVNGAVACSKNFVDRFTAKLNSIFTEYPEGTSVSDGVLFTLNSWEEAKLLNGFEHELSSNTYYYRCDYAISLWGDSNRWAKGRGSSGLLSLYTKYGNGYGNVLASLNGSYLFKEFCHDDISCSNSQIRIPTIVPSMTIDSNQLVSDVDRGDWVYVPGAEYDAQKDIPVSVPKTQEGVKVDDYLGSDTKTGVGTLTNEGVFNPALDDSIPGVGEGDTDIPGTGPVVGSIDFSPLYMSFADRFPFSIPFDIKRIIDTFQAEKQEPIFHVDMSGFDYTKKAKNVGFTLDLTKFEKLFSIVRFFILVSFVIVLAIKTRDIIRG